MYELKRNTAGDYYIYGGPLSLSAGVIGRALNSTDYSASRGEIRKEEKSLLEKITGINSRNIVMLEQVHGDSIIHVVSEPSADQVAVAEADGLITAIRGVCLVIRTADCLPVFIYDPVQNVLGAVHSGWKGTLLDISGRCVEDMVRIYGSKPENINAFIFPSIGPASYEVNNDVAKYFPDETEERDGRLFVNLWLRVERSLIKEGLDKSRIFNPQICNRINHGEFYSHRHGDLGRNLNYAFIR
ncbi:MAG TPA: polyphenol oxidase family protein [Spirochaetota bacterium]|nr:polyphenol oxidase family protein [Spirochaetota bacterium]HPJ36607.1 polyphenol oxidase family protein [Spirochaetota bacterium]